MEHTQPDMGILCIRNLQSDKRLLIATDKLSTAAKEHRFMLDMGTHPCEELQQEYEEIGLEVFTLEILDAVPATTTQTERDSQLASLLTKWQTWFINEGIGLYKA